MKIIMESFKLLGLNIYCKVMKSKRVRKADHVARITVMRNACKIQYGNLNRRHNLRQDICDNNLKIYLKEEGHALAQLVEALSEGRRLYSRSYH